MVREEWWGEIRWLFEQERWNQVAIARELDLDRKTVRRCLRLAQWTLHQRRADAQAHWQRDRSRSTVGHTRPRFLVGCVAGLWVRD